MRRLAATCGPVDSDLRSGGRQGPEALNSPSRRDAFDVDGEVERGACDVACQVGGFDPQVELRWQVWGGGPNETPLVANPPRDRFPRSLRTFGEVERNRAFWKKIIHHGVLDDQGTRVLAFPIQGAGDSGRRLLRINLNPSIRVVSAARAIRGESVGADDDHAEAEQTVVFDFDVKRAFAIWILSPDLPGATLIDRPPEFDFRDGSAGVVFDFIVEAEGARVGVERLDSRFVGKGRRCT